jgi:hypothetical protein
VLGLAGKPEADGVSLPGDAVGVGLAVARLVDESFEVHADCDISNRALKPASKTAFPNCDLINPP